MNDMSVKEAVPEKPASWLELLLYLFAGFGLYLLASIGVGLLFREMSIWVSVTAYALNVIFLGGSMWVLSVWRKKASWSEIGIWPVRWQWYWLLIVVGLVIVFIPIRTLLGVITQLVLEGNLDSMQARAQLLMGGETFSWLDFAITLLGAGILAPVSEELYFRGLLHRWFQSRFGFWPRVLLSSVLFGLAHFDSLAVIISSFIMGVMNAIAYEKSKSLWLPILIHVFNNSLAVVILYALLLIQQYVPIS